MGKDTLGQHRYFDALYDALCHSIKHWNRICAYIKAAMYDGMDIDDFDAIEISWKVSYGDTVHGNTCPLCMLYENDCDDCILKEYHNECNYEGSLWYRVINSESWEDMLDNAEVLAKFLVLVKRELVEARQ